MKVARHVKQAQCGCSLECYAGDAKYEGEAYGQQSVDPAGDQSIDDYVLCHTLVN